MHSPPPPQVPTPFFYPSTPHPKKLAVLVIRVSTRIKVTWRPATLDIPNTRRNGYTVADVPCMHAEFQQLAYSEPLERIPPQFPPCSNSIHLLRRFEIQPRIFQLAKHTLRTNVPLAKHAKHLGMLCMKYHQHFTPLCGPGFRVIVLLEDDTSQQIK
ncbi:hypothetical protein BDDG_11734 [Blastomyces dermatitidis ATCC 18188]|uniref:Uncharacterized protein n=1 Tax=Ajellomyces dermatitidis (strain ATCC 18188 / CBS 674.68) TaxID=653446 RepID=A0A0J9HCP2_AJEDA|nr:hypothetical protein BDDG_11734 [Blastomyces dermatitidis ATCC 18188]